MYPCKTKEISIIISSWFCPNDPDCQFEKWCIVSSNRVIILWLVRQEFCQYKMSELMIYLWLSIATSSCINAYFWTYSIQRCWYFKGSCPYCCESQMAVQVHMLLKLAFSGLNKGQSLIFCLLEGFFSKNISAASNGLANLNWLSKIIIWNDLHLSLIILRLPCQVSNWLLLQVHIEFACIKIKQA